MPIPKSIYWRGALLVCARRSVHPSDRLPLYHFGLRLCVCACETKSWPLLFFLTRWCGAAFILLAEAFCSFLCWCCCCVVVEAGVSCARRTLTRGELVVWCVHRVCVRVCRETCNTLMTSICPASIYFLHIWSLRHRLRSYYTLLFLLQEVIFQFFFEIILF